MPPLQTGIYLHSIISFKSVQKTKPSTASTAQFMLPKLNQTKGNTCRHSTRKHSQSMYNSLTYI